VNRRRYDITLTGETNTSLRFGVNVTQRRGRALPQTLHAWTQHDNRMGRSSDAELRACCGYAAGALGRNNNSNQVQIQ